MANAPASDSNPLQSFAQQLVSACTSAGELAGQLVKSLIPPPSEPHRRAGEPSPQGAPRSRSTQELRQAELPEQRRRRFDFRKILTRGRSGKAQLASVIVISDGYSEHERDPQRARAYLGDEQEKTAFEEAKREALLLLHLEGRGESPTRLARRLNALLRMGQDRDFKHMLAELLKPQMDALAGRLQGLSPQERRLLAALIARAAYQVRGRSAESFARLLATAGAMEGVLLAQSSEEPVARAARLTQALRRAPSPWYRAALLEAGRPGLEKLAGDLVGLPAADLHHTWVSLLHAAELLEPNALSTLAEVLVAGLPRKGGAGTVGPLAQALGPALRQVPSGATLVAQLIATFAAHGEPQAAELLAMAFGEVLRQARGVCVPTLRALRDGPADKAQEAALHRQLEGHAPLLVSLLPACSRLLEKGQGLPPTVTPVLGEALVSVATLHLVSATPSGQRLLRHTLLAQERGSETFLSTLPRAALTLAQPKLAHLLMEAGLAPAHFQFGGRPFLERVALSTGRAVLGPLLARGHKYDAATAKALLRSAIRSNAALFGLTPDGAYLAADALLALKEKPGQAALKGTLLRLGKIRKKYSLGQHAGSIDPFQELISALAVSRPSPPAGWPGARPSPLR